LFGAAEKFSRNTARLILFIAITHRPQPIFARMWNFTSREKAANTRKSSSLLISWLIQSFNILSFQKQLWQASEKIVSCRGNYSDNHLSHTWQPPFWQITRPFYLTSDSISLVLGMRVRKARLCCCCEMWKAPFFSKGAALPTYT